MPSYLIMTRILFTFFAVVLIIASACETDKADEVHCFPNRMSANIIMGGVTVNQTADFLYIPETELLDHITWSDMKTEYFEYDAYGILKVVRLKKVDYKVQEEQWFSYEGNKLVRIDECTKRLDIKFLEPIDGDSTYTGYREFEYSGTNITLEKIYLREKKNKDKLILEKAYEYDNSGNIIHNVTTNVVSKTVEVMALSYHQSHHPYSRLHTYFTGETFIQNVLTKTDETKNLDYTYEMKLDLNRYPEQIIEKTNGMVSRIIRYTYFCK